VYSNEGHQWLQDEDDRLIDAYAAGGNEDELVHSLGRSPNAIARRLWELLAPRILAAVMRLDSQFDLLDADPPQDD
jgi:hypothetical protein